MEGRTPPSTSKPEGARYSPTVTPWQFGQPFLAQDFDVTVMLGGRLIRMYFCLCHAAVPYLGA